MNWFNRERKTEWGDRRGREGKRKEKLLIAINVWIAEF